MAQDMDGKVIKVGSYVSWKSGIETSGKVTKVNGSAISVDYNDPYSDEPRSTVVQSHRVWQE